MDAMASERPQPRDELVASQVEAFVYILQTVAGHRLDADQGAKDSRALHGLEELRVFGGLHRDLCIQHEIVWQFGEAAHQDEAFLPKRLQLAKSCGVGSTPRLGKVLERHRIEVIVRKRDEAKSETTQLDNLTDNAID